MQGFQGMQNISFGSEKQVRQFYLNMTTEKNHGRYHDRFHQITRKMYEKQVSRQKTINQHIFIRKTFQ